MSEVYGPSLYYTLIHCGCRFFKNKGAVAGVFVLVGLAILVIAASIFIAIRRRQRTRKIENDTAISASLAAAGFKRSALDEDGDGFDMRNRSTSTYLGGMTQRSGSGLDTNYDGGFNPYIEYGIGQSAAERDGYVPARTSSPPLLPPLAIGTSTTHGHAQSDDDAGQYRNRCISSSSYEPLLAAGAEEGPNVKPPTPPTRNPKRLADKVSTSLQISPALGGSLDPGGKKDEPDSASSEYSSESGDYNDRLDPGLKHRVRTSDDGRSTSDLRDDEDYSRPVLGVRNMTNMSSVTTSSEAG